jgi:uncharacterized protein YcnI
LPRPLRPLRPLALAAILVALVLAADAAAHVTVTPPFVSADGPATLTLTAPNERDEPMTGFVVVVPEGLRISNAEPSGSWIPETADRTVTWSGGSLHAEKEERFVLGLDVDTEPGAVELEARQLYPGGEVVTWPVALTVTPAADRSSRSLGWVLVVLGGLLLAVGLAAFVWRRRRGALQER